MKFVLSNVKSQTATQLLKVEASIQRCSGKKVLKIQAKFENTYEELSSLFSKVGKTEFHRKGF